MRHNVRLSLSNYMFDDDPILFWGSSDESTLIDPEILYNSHNATFYVELFYDFEVED